MRKNSKGFSFVEMEMSLVVAAIIVIAIGSFASISSQWYSNTKQESNLLSDISYTFRLLKTNVRSSSSWAFISPPSPNNWVANYPVLQLSYNFNYVFGGVSYPSGSSIYFGLYNDTATSSHDLVYATDNKANNPVVTALKVYSTDTLSTCTGTCSVAGVCSNGSGTCLYSCNLSSSTCSSTCSSSCSNALTVNLNGTQNKESFFNGKNHQIAYNLSESIFERVQAQ